MAAGACPEPAAVVSSVDALASRESTSGASGATQWRTWGEGRPLVLLHGASGAWAHWIRNIEPLAAHFRVLAADMPGFGDSDEPPAPHTAEGLADLVAAGIDRLAPPPGALDIAGFSFGSIIGGLVAARLGRRVRTLVMISPGGLGLPLAELPPLLRIDRSMSPEAVRRAHAENLARLMIGDPAKVDDLAVFVHMENVRRARFKSGSIPGSDALLRALPHVTAPIRTIWGSRDAFFRGQLEARQRILTAEHPGHVSHVIEGAGHWVPYESAPEVNRLLLAILR